MQAARRLTDEPAFLRSANDGNVYSVLFIYAPFPEPSMCMGVSVY